MYLKDRADSEGLLAGHQNHCSGVGAFPLYGQAGTG